MASSSASGTSLTTAGALQPDIVPPHQADQLYLLRERNIQSRTQVPTFLAMDPWTCSLYVLKEYPHSSLQKDAIDKRLALLKPLPVSDKDL
jgi:hypothetical protein